MKKLFALLLSLAVLFPMLPCKALANGLLDKKVRQGINEIDTAIASSESQALQCTAEPEPGPDVRAIEGTYENLKYSIENDEVTITGYVNEPTGALTIPETIEGYPVTGIGDYAFDNCDSLTSVEMSNVKTVGRGAFHYCYSITSVKMPNVETIRGSAFYYCGSLKRVEMPNVQTIGDDAFVWCSLTSVEMPNVKTVGYRAFRACVNLTLFIISSDNANYSVDGGILYNKDKTTICAYPSARGDIKIADSVQRIGESAFEGTPLTSVEMPNVETIGDRAFRDCGNIKSVKMPNVQTIGDSAFEGTPLTSVEMPNVQKIRSEAFRLCSALTSVYFYSDAPTSFGNDVFYSCASDFTIYYAKGTSGWTTPTWNGYPTQEFDPIGYHYVTFIDGLTGEQIAKRAVQDGLFALAPEPPTHDGSTFTSWDKDFSNVTEDMMVTAQYKINLYTVTYLDGITGEVISTATVEHGADAVFPTPPEHEGYIFTGWDSDGMNITADTTITALYEEIVTVLQGDANGDGVINGKDVTLIRRYITGGYDVEVILEAADINGDGVINGKDITLLRRLIVGGYGSTN